jgi:MSHA biogenesis protein MshJ
MSLNVRAMAINVSSRFTAMTLRERGLVFAALLAVMIVAWDSLLMQPLNQRKGSLTQEMQSLQDNINQLAANLSGENGGDPVAASLTKHNELKQSLAAVDAQLQSVAAGLIPPQRMVSAMRELLDRQQGLKLISLRNLPPHSLAPPITTNDTTSITVAATTSGPYVHSIEMVIEGDYFAVLTYLRAVEQLKWRFYWQSMDLMSTDYPKNRVRIQLNSLSMDKDWLGV